MSLSAQTKATLQEFLFDNRMGTIFGDDMEDEYLWDGVEIVGINQLSDEQLVEECESFGGGDLIEIAKAELAVDEMLGPSKCPKLTELRNSLITHVLESLADHLHDMSNTELLIYFAKNDDHLTSGHRPQYRFDLLHAAIIADE